MFIITILMLVSNIYIYISIYESIIKFISKFLLVEPYVSFTVDELT